MTAVASAGAASPTPGAPLRRLSTHQANEYRASGRYNADLLAMLPHKDPGRDRVTLVVSTDGQAYWAWTRTGSDFCLGIATSRGAVTSSYYADDGRTSWQSRRGCALGG